MTFIRSKEIPPRSGNWYDYEVMNIREGGKTRQKVIQYLGKRGTQHPPLIGSSKQAPTSAMITPVVVVAPTMPEPRITKMKTPAKQIASALGMYYGGMSLDAIQQQFKQDYGQEMSESNYWNWVTRFTNAAIQQSKDFHPNVGDTWVADETYMKLGKQKVYFWDLIDTKTRYLLASHVSTTRGTKDAKRLMEKAAKRAGKTPKTVITDKLAAYIMGVEDAFGSETKHRKGGPFDIENSTGMIERFHKTLEQRTQVFQKYKDIKNIRLLTDGWLINYNFFKQNEGVGNIPPAQAANSVVPFKDWNDVVRPEDVPEVEYKVSRHHRPLGKYAKPVVDATLTPTPVKGSGA